MSEIKNPAAYHVPANFTASELKRIILKAEKFAKFAGEIKTSQPLLGPRISTPQTIPVDGKITLEELKDFVESAKDSVNYAEKYSRNPNFWASKEKEELYIKIATAWKDEKTLENDFKFIADQNDDNFGQQLMSNTDVDKLVESKTIKK